MRWYSWLLMLGACCSIACSGASRTVLDTDSHASTLTEPVCSQAASSQPNCPACPIYAPCPSVAPAPIPPSWHCIDLHLRNSSMVLGFCWATLQICEKKRKELVADKLGTATPCVTQQIAYCVGLTGPEGGSWRVFCERTPEGCQRNRKILLDDPPDEEEHIGICQPTNNLDPHKLRAAKISTPAAQ